MNEEDISISQSGVIFVSEHLIEKIRTFPLSVEVTHCNSTFSTSPFDIYATCPICRTEIKLRAFSANYELADVFDAVFEWLIKPEAQQLFKHRQQAILEDLNAE